MSQQQFFLVCGLKSCWPKLCFMVLRMNLGHLLCARQMGSSRLLLLYSWGQSLN